MNIRDYLISIPACKPALDWLGDLSAERMWRECERSDWLFWLAPRIGVDHRRIVLAGAACAWTALRYVPAGEMRPAAAVDLARRYGLGKAIPVGTLRSATYAAYAANAANAANAAAYAAVSAAVSAAYATYAASSANAAAYAAYAARAEVTATHCRFIRNYIGWPRVRRALVAKGVDL